MIFNPNVRQNRIPMYAISSIHTSPPLHNHVQSFFIYCRFINSFVFIFVFQFYYFSYYLLIYSFFYYMVCQNHYSHLIRYLFYVCITFIDSTIPICYTYSSAKLFCNPWIYFCSYQSIFNCLVSGYSVLILLTDLL